MILLDTHAFLWFLTDDSRLPAKIKDKIETDKDVFVSIASFWEIAIKNSLGKLQLPASITEMMEVCRSLQITVLPINAAQLERLKDLPWIHRDPFDRLLICQALEKSDGGVVSVVGGFSQSNHSRPLYKYIALLISALLDSGYELVDLNSL